MLHYAAVKVSDLERSGAFYDSILAPLGWRRQDAPANCVSWGLIKAEFFIELSDTQRPGYGQISFPAKISATFLRTSRAWSTASAAETGSSSQ